MPTDVTAKAEVDELARQAVHGTGRLDVWANVAGVIRNSLLVDTTEEDLDAIVTVNLKGVVAPGFIETPMTSRNWTNPDGSIDDAKRAEVLGARSAQSPST